MNIICKLMNKPCIHSDPRKADEGVYENCRLCEVYEEWIHKIDSGEIGKRSKGRAIEDRGCTICSG